MSECGLPLKHLGAGFHPTAIYLTCLGTPTCRIVGDHGKLCRIVPLEACDQVLTRDGGRADA